MADFTNLLLLPVRYYELYSFCRKQKKSIWKRHRVEKQEKLRRTNCEGRLKKLSETRERDREFEREQGSKTRERERGARGFCILSTTVSFYTEYKT